MTRTMLAAVLLLLAGCAGVALDPPGTPRGRCQRQALHDPVVRAATQQTDEAWVGDRSAALKVQMRVTRDAVNNCLAPLGLAPPGGVEPRNP